jgi:hypothetical protein
VDEGVQELPVEKEFDMWGQALPIVYPFIP